MEREDPMVIKTDIVESRGSPRPAKLLEICKSIGNQSPW